MRRWDARADGAGGLFGCGILPQLWVAAPAPFLLEKTSKGLGLIHMQKRVSLSFISNFFTRQENHFCLALNNNVEHGEPR